MHVSLLMVGAHNGQKEHSFVIQAAALGAVILIEPVPFLFARLSETYAGIPNVTCLNCCVAPEVGYVNFYAPTEGAISVIPWGDQIGSMNADHAVRCEQALVAHVVEIQVEAVTFVELVQQFDITSIGLLFTDTEGYDTKLLLRFPFDKVRPNQVKFEYKHADGTFNIGFTLGHLLIKLANLGYDIQIVDMENCVATQRLA